MAQADNVEGSSWAVVVLALLANFSCSGIIFGWGPLQILLEEDGVYRSLCPEFEPVCADRTARLILLYTLGTTACVVGSAPCGFLVDYCGPVVCNAISGTLVTLGLLLIGVSDENGFDAFWLGCIFLGFGGSLVLMVSIPVAFVVPPSRQPLIMSAVNCMFDASSIVFLLVYQLFSTFGVTRRVLLIGYSAVSAALHAALVIAWSRGPAARLRSKQKAELEAHKTDVPVPDESDTTGKSVDVPSCTDAGDTTDHDKQANESPEVADISKVAVTVETTAQHPRLHGLPLKQQLFTFEFAFATLFMSLQLFRSNLYLGTNKRLLEDYDDARTGYTYTQVFTASLPCSVVCLPIISYCLSRRGFGDTFLLVVLLGVIWNGVALIDSLPAQLVSFAAFTNYRALFYSAHFVYISHTFGSRTSASAHGLMTFSAGAMNFLIWPSTIFAESFSENGFVYLYVIVLLLNAPPFFATLFLRRRLKDNPVGDCRIVRETACPT